MMIMMMMMIEKMVESEGHAIVRRNDPSTAGSFDVVNRTTAAASVFYRACSPVGIGRAVSDVAWLPSKRTFPTKR